MTAYQTSSSVTSLVSHTLSKLEMSLDSGKFPSDADIRVSFESPAKSVEKLQNTFWSLDHIQFLFMIFLVNFPLLYSYRNLEEL